MNEICAFKERLRELKTLIRKVNSLKNLLLKITFFFPFLNLNRNIPCCYTRLRNRQKNLPLPPRAGRRDLLSFNWLNLHPFHFWQSFHFHDNVPGHRSLVLYCKADTLQNSFQQATFVPLYYFDLDLGRHNSDQ